MVSAQFESGYFCLMKQIIISVFVGIALVAGYYFGKSLYLRPDIEQGIKASEINAILPDGSEFALSQLKGKYVLLDFWGSWCKPCREEHPKLVDLYNKFHPGNNDGSGFEIVSFGVERNPENWQRAIKDDQLEWPYHFVSTNLFDHPVVEAYKVKQIPTRFLINPEGIIIAVDPTFNAISAILKKRLIKTTPK